MDAIIGPKFNYLSNFAIEKHHDRVPGNRAVLKEEIEPPHGLSIPITMAHALMRGLPQKIAASFQPYFDAAGVSTDIDSTTLDADAAKLTEQYKGHTISVEVGRRTATFRNGGEILATLFNLNALGQYAVPRQQEARNHLTKNVGNAKDAFNSLITLTQSLRQNFVPGTGPDAVQNFDELRWDFNIEAVNGNFAKNAGYFHRARHYAFLTIDSHDANILPMFYWKEPRPQERQPFAIETPEEAASCMLALGEKLNKDQIGNNVHPLGNRLMDDAQRVADGHASVTQCLTARTLEQLDYNFPFKEAGMGKPCKWAAAIAGLKAYIQKEPPLEVKANDESPVRPERRNRPSHSGNEEHTGR